MLLESRSWRAGQVSAIGNHNNSLNETKPVALKGIPLGNKRGMIGGRGGDSKTGWGRRRNQKKKDGLYLVTGNSRCPRNSWHRPPGEPRHIGALARALAAPSK